MNYTPEELEWIEVVKERDPAIHSEEEAFLYPCYDAIMTYRKAHELYKQGHYVRARRLSLEAASRTNIEIHPGAIIGERFFIDHGFGVVIGETAVIGDNVTLFHGVTLGGTGKDAGKRHPTLGNNVTIYAESMILGNVTVGDNVIIGAGTVSLKDIPANTTVVGAPARIVKIRHEDGTEEKVNIKL